MRRHSLSNTFLLYISLFTILAVVGAAYLWASMEYSRFEKESSELRERMMAAKRTEVRRRTEEAFAYLTYKKEQAEKRLKRDLKNRTHEAHQTATYIYEQNKRSKSKDEIAKLIHDALHAASWNDGKGYYFAEDMKGLEIINRNNPELVGKNIIDIQDSKGVYLVKEIIKVAREKGEGFCSYHWNKPNEPGVLMPKYSYVKYFEPLDWVIGTGRYLADEEKTVQDEVLALFDGFDLGGTSYVFGGTYDGISLTKPAKGKNMSEIEDANGKKIVQELIRAAKKGGGYVEYVMPKLGDKPSGRKLSYVIGVDDWRWYIGYGAYLNEIDEVVAVKENVLRKEMTSSILKLVVLSGSLIILIIFLTKMISSRIATSINTFTDFFRRASHEYVKIPDDHVHFTEFEVLANAANKMIDEREEVHAEREVLQTELQRAQKMEAIGLMAGGVAHDLNNILTGLVNIPELLLLKMEEDNPLRRHVKLALEASLRAGAVVNDLLTVGRGVVSERKTTDINNLVREFMQSPECRELLTHYSEVQLEESLKDKQMLVDCSPIHVGKSLMNLVINAVEAVGERGSGKVTIAVSQVEIVEPQLAYQEILPGRYVVLSVQDNGSGITEEDRQRIFEPFYTRKVLDRSGTGLGLAIVWNTMKDHAGFIDIDSSGEGTVFKLYFPASSSERMVGEGAEKSGLQYGHGETVLIVDDEEIQRVAAAEMLDHLGYRYASVASGEEAVEYLKQRTADILLLDMDLGKGMNGLETYRQVLSLHPGQKAVVVTGYAKNVDVEATLELGASSWLHKPYLIKAMAEAVYSTLQGEGAA